MSETKVTITITGLAFCRPNQNELQVLFLHPDHHELGISITKIIGSRRFAGIYKFPQKTKMKFKLTDVVSRHPDALNPAKDFKNIVDIDDLHKGDIGLKAESALENSYLSIPNSICYTDTLSGKEYEIWKWNTANNSKELATRKKIGLKIGIDLYIQENGRIDFDCSGQQNTAFSFPYEAGARYEIDFDNACPDNLCGDDFGYYYDLLDGNGFEFEEVLPRYSSGDLGGFTDEAACNPSTGKGKGCNLENYYNTGNC